MVGSEATTVKQQSSSLVFYLLLLSFVPAISVATVIIATFAAAISELTVIGDNNNDGDEITDSDTWSFSVLNLLIL